MPKVRYFQAGETDRQDELYEMIRAIEKHQEAIEEVVLARDWEPANVNDWSEIRRLISQLGDIMHRARWAHMWELCELYRDATIEDNIRSNVDGLYSAYDEACREETSGNAD